MPRTVALVIASAALALGSFADLSSQAADAERYWPQWRGPHANGRVHHRQPAARVERDQEHRAGRSPMPGRGNSSPVVWGDRIFVTTRRARRRDRRRAARAARRPAAARHAPLRGDGASTARPARPSGSASRASRSRTRPSHFENGTWASGSPITDGQRAVRLLRVVRPLRLRPERQAAVGEGPRRQADAQRVRRGVHAGAARQHARRRLGPPERPVVRRRARHARRQGAVARAAQGDRHLGDAARPRGQRPAAGRSCPAMERVRAYDLANGSVVWEADGLTMNTIPSPVLRGRPGVPDERLPRQRPARRSASPTPRATSTAPAPSSWTLDRDTPYVPSPLLYDGMLYFLKTNTGILSAFDAKTGKPHYQQQRLDGVPNVFASPVGARGRVYVPGREGATHGDQGGPAFEVLATNTLDDGFDASPALVDNEIYLRGYRASTRSPHDVNSPLAPTASKLTWRRMRGPWPPRTARSDRSCRAAATSTRRKTIPRRPHLPAHPGIVWCLSITETSGRRTRFRVQVRREIPWR